jgi:N-acetylneuraminic acid mutarotase
MEDILAEYHPGLDEWKPKRDLINIKNIIQRNAGISNSINNKVYIGLGLRYGMYSDFWEYDITNDIAKPLANLNWGGNQQPVNFLIDKKIFVGTTLSGTNNFQKFKELYEYNIIDNVWKKVQDFPGEPRFAPRYAAINGKGYIGFGTSSIGNNHFLIYGNTILIVISGSNLPIFRV